MLPKRFWQVGAVDGLVRVSSAPPINVTAGGDFLLCLGLYTTQADIVPGQPYWIPDPTYWLVATLNPGGVFVTTRWG